MEKGISAGHHIPYASLIAAYLSVASTEAYQYRLLNIAYCPATLLVAHPQQL